MAQVVLLKKEYSVILGTSFYEIINRYTWKKLISIFAVETYFFGEIDYRQLSYKKMQKKWKFW